MLFYVYVLKMLPEGRVFYVGKGSKNRMFWHRKVLAHSDTKEWRRGVYERMRVRLNGHSFIEEKVFETEDEVAALLHERSLIDYYGFDNLVNTQTHAFTGRRLKDDARLKMRQARLAYVAKLQIETGHKMLPEVVAKISASNKGKTLSAEVRQKLSVSVSAAYGGHFTDDHRKKMSIAAMSRERSAEFEFKRLAALRKVTLGKPKDLTKARLSRARFVCAITSPTGAQFYAFGCGIVKLLRGIGMAMTTFYRARRLGACAGWRVQIENF